MASLFSDIQIIHRFVGNTRVQWRWTDRNAVSALQPMKITLEWARTPVGEWKKAENAVIFDNGVAFDPTERLFGQHDDLFYRIRADAGGTSYFSEGLQIGTRQMGAMWPAAKETLRLTELNFKQNYMTVDGCLFKRRIWGPRCRRCTDPATGGVESLRCPVCFQTGIVRGYYPPYPMKALLSNKSRTFHYRGAQDGASISHGLTAKVMAYPVPVDERDIWMNYATGEMYLIGKNGQPVQDTVKVANFVIQQSMTLDIIPAGEIVYMLPTYCCDGEYTQEYDELCAPYEKPAPVCDSPESSGVAGAEESCPDVDFGSPESTPVPDLGEETLFWPE